MTHPCDSPPQPGSSGPAASATSAADVPLIDVACPLCGSGNSQPRYRSRDWQYSVPGIFTVVRCGACGHHFTNPRPTIEALARCYPDNYGPHRATPSRNAAPAESANGLAQPLWLRLAKAVPGLRTLYYWLNSTSAQLIPQVDNDERRAVELGCAAGDFLRQLQDAGWQVCGVELVSSVASQARQRGLDVRDGTLEAARFPDSSFDAAFAWMVMEHLPDPVATCREFRRILRPGGWLLLSVPNFGSWERVVFGRHWIALELPRHLQHFDHRSITRLLNTTGFEVVEIVHQANWTNVVGSLGITLWSAFPRRSLGPRLVRWFLYDPPFIVQQLLRLMGKLAALCRQSGRITVVARARGFAEGTPS